MKISTFRIKQQSKLFNFILQLKSNQIETTESINKLSMLDARCSIYWFGNRAKKCQQCVSSVYWFSIFFRISNVFAQKHFQVDQMEVENQFSLAYEFTIVNDSLSTYKSKQIFATKKIKVFKLYSIIIIVPFVNGKFKIWFPKTKQFTIQIPISNQMNAVTIWIKIIVRSIFRQWFWFAYEANMPNTCSAQSMHAFKVKRCRCNLRTIIVFQIMGSLTAKVPLKTHKVGK